MIEKKASNVVRLIVCLLFVFATFSLPQAQARELKLGHNTSPLSPTHKASLKFAKLVNQKTGGNVTVAVYPSAQLGKPADTDGELNAACGVYGTSQA